MKNRINQLARGIFEENVPKIQLGEMSIEELISVNEVYTGELRIFSDNNIPVRGIVYSDNPYVSVVNCNFATADNLIAYKVDARGRNTHDIIDGRFDIVSDGGEKSIPFVFKVVDKTENTELGKIKNLFHFANYVQNNYERALKLFTSQKFKDIFIGNDIELLNLYKGLVKGNDVRVAVEEFLVATHKKAKINISMSDSEKTFEKPKENIEEYITLTKDSWGYVSATVEKDGDFLKLYSDYIDSEVFAGNVYRLSYLIDVERLHAGKNYGRIIITTASQVLEYKITVINGCIEDKENYITIKRAKHNLIQRYIDFRTQKINANTWINESQKQVEIIRNIDDRDYFVKLFQTHLFMADKKDTQAKWLLDSVKEDIVILKEKNLPMYCYYLYLTSLYNKDKLYALKVMEKIRKYYEAGNNDWRILWVLLYLDDENDKNKSLKLIRIKEQFYAGCMSPVMYLEAAQILEEIPMLYRVLDEFEIQVIRFACNHDMISKKTADYVSHMVKNEKNIKKPVIDILMNLYKKFQSDEVLMTLCEAMIRNNCVGKQYFEWYHLGVMKEFKVTKLYEYYIDSIDKQSMKILPKQILLYFMYNTDVDYKAKAYVYANVTYNRLNNPSIFDSYKKDIEKFAVEQLVEGNINDNLSLIYNYVLNRELINENNNENLPKMLFSYKVNCQVPNVKNIIVRHKESATESIYPVNRGVAYIQLYTKNAVIILENYAGERYAQNSFYTMTKLLDEDGYIEELKGIAKENTFVNLYFAEKYKDRYDMSTEINDVYTRVLKENSVTKLFKQEIAIILTDSYYDSFETDESFNIFVDLLQDVSLPKVYGVKLLEMFIARGEYKRAYEYIKENNVYPTNHKHLYRLTTKLVSSIEKPSDIILDKLCDMCIACKKYDETIITYLVKNYNLTLKKMLGIWDMAGNFMVERYQLSERIIAQSLFTGTSNEGIIEVFEDYYNHGANERIVEAYISYNCYNYFVKNMDINEDILRIVEHRMKYGMELIEICKLALLHYYSKCDSLTEKQAKYSSKLMDEFLRQNMYFAFYKGFAGKIPLPYSVADKTYVEHRTSPKAKVTIHYIYEDDIGQKGYVVEDMKNICEGIYVKPFVLFYGEAIQYYITEVIGAETNVTESTRIVNGAVSPNQTEGRFEAINDIIASYELKDMATMKKLIHSYEVRDYIADKVFTIR